MVRPQTSVPTEANVRHNVSHYLLAFPRRTGRLHRIAVNRSTGQRTSGAKRCGALRRTREVDRSPRVSYTSCATARPPSSSTTPSPSNWRPSSGFATWSCKAPASPPHRPSSGPLARRWSAPVASQPAMPVSRSAPGERHRWLVTSGHGPAPVPPAAARPAHRRRRLPLGGPRRPGAWPGPRVTLARCTVARPLAGAPAAAGGPGRREPAPRSVPPGRPLATVQIASGTRHRRARALRGRGAAGHSGRRRRCDRRGRRGAARRSSRLSPERSASA